jgi:nitrogenase subunit NifH
MYTRSISESVDFLSKSSGIKYIIHNSGSKTNKSIIDDYTDYTVYNPIRVDIRENLMRNTNKYFYTLFSHSPDENIAINMNKINTNTNTRNNRSSILEINTNREEFFTDLNIKGEPTRVYGKTPKNLIGGRTRKKLKKHL